MAGKNNSDKKGLTVMVIPHDDSQSLSFRLPLWLLQLLVIITAVLLGAVFFLLRGYVMRTDQINELDRLREANRVQEEQINRMTQETDSLVQMMEDLEILSRQIQELMGNNQSQADVTAAGGAVASVQVVSRGDNIYDRAQENLRILQSNLPDQLARLDDLKGDLVEYNRRLNATPTRWPVRGWITSRFGYRKDPITGSSDFHSALDIANSYGTAVYASAAGQVVTAQYRSGYGNLIVINHGYGFRTYYAHLSGYAVSVGEWVEKGEHIGYLGNSGRSTGPHLHFEVHVNGVPVNPFNYLE